LMPRVLRMGELGFGYVVYILLLLCKIFDLRYLRMRDYGFV